MDDPHGLSGEVDSELAEAAAAAATVGDTEAEDPSICKICHKTDAGRQTLRFLPVEADAAARAAAPTVMTWGEDVTLHEFCGKTATIMPDSATPEYEILPKAGIKNKHGIGAEVNGALARTRYAIVKKEGVKEKHYYLVKEFEANLSAIRNAHAQAQMYHHLQTTTIPQDTAGMGYNTHQQTDNYQQPMYPPLAPDPHQQYLPPAQTHAHETYAPVAAMKAPPHRASAGHIHKPSSRREEAMSYPAFHDSSGMMADGKIRCGCGGTHLPPGTPKGAASWRNHVMTKRHQKWMEDNGLLGAV